MEVFELYIQTHFSAAHALKGYAGECANVHGHNWVIDVFVRCERLNHIGIGMDFKDIKEAVRDVLKSEDETLSERESDTLVVEWKEHITKYYYECTDDMLAGLADMYVNDIRFKENIDKYKTGLAEFISDAIMNYYVNART